MFFARRPLQIALTLMPAGIASLVAHAACGRDGAQDDLGYPARSESSNARMALPLGLMS